MPRFFSAQSSQALISLVLLAAGPLTTASLAQDASDVYLLDIERRGDRALVGEPVRLTDRNGYDNQPAFSADGSTLFYTSMRGEQSDIWQVALPTEAGQAPGAPKAFRETPESEYSPTPIPGEQALSVVRVEADGRQRLWRLPLDPAAPASVILPDVAPVGYHAWSADGEQLVLFVLDEPHRLVRVAAARPDETRTVATNIGRSLHRIPGRDAFSFIAKGAIEGETGWRVASLDLAGDRIATLAPTLLGREDVAYAGDELWGADGSRLLRFTDGAWREVADLGPAGIAGITRLAFDAEGRRLALVARRLPEKTRRLEIVGRAIEHHGGDLFRHSETRLRQCSAAGCSRVQARVDGDRFAYDVTGPLREGVRRVRFTNDSLELWSGESPADLSATTIEPQAAQGLRDWAMARLYFPFLPFRLDDPSVWKQDLGVETWDGRALRTVRVTFDKGSSSDADDVYLYWFDDETAELVQFAYSYSGQPGGLRFRTLEKPRRVGGLLFHDQKNYGAEGPGLTVERLTPETVRDLELVSTVTFEDLSVRPLGER